MADENAANSLSGPAPDSGGNTVGIPARGDGAQEAAERSGAGRETEVSRDDLPAALAGGSGDSPANSQHERVKLGFELGVVSIPLSQILPSKSLGEQAKRSHKYAAVVSSIQEIGIVEPLVVYPMRTGGTDPPGQYLLLDGHLRIEALKELGREETLCLIATDDESYNYNHKVNRLVPIQEHFMILRALERGISEERIARALRVDVAHIREKRYLLRGICTEVVVLLKEAPIAASALRHLRAVKPTRQVAIAEMMNLVGNYSSTYCQALVAATPQEQRVRARKRSAKMALSATEVARMQREEDALQRGWQAREETYGQDFLNLVVARGYVSRLLGNARVMQFLSGQYPDLLEGLRQIAESASLEG